MKHSLLFTVVLSFTISLSLYSRKTINAKVVDKDTGNPIKDAVVLLSGTQINTTTNYVGFFKMTIDSIKTLEITKENFTDLVIDVPGVDRFKIEMQKFDMTKHENKGTIAEFPGGTAAFYKYIKNNMKKPREVKWGRESGNVIVEFEVDSVGNIPENKVIVTKGLSEACDKEAIRLIKESPKWWIPATDEGNYYSMIIHIPINFK